MECGIVARLVLETGQGARVTAHRAAPGPTAHRHVQQDHEVGPEPVGGPGLQVSQHGQVQAAAVALVGKRRVREAVADDDALRVPAPAG